MAKAVLLLSLAAFAALLPQPDLWAAQSPASCPVNFSVQSISLTDWDAGLGAWDVDTYGEAADFVTPDWSAVGDLPDSRAGTAAFVADLIVGPCPGSENQSGVLTLTSPSIVIPADAVGSRIALNHWFDIEPGFDGGNLKISVNGGDFSLVPSSAFEINPYTDVLEPAFDDPPDNTSPWNLNPLAEQEAFTGPGLQLDGGYWGVSRVNLATIAVPGDSIQLRFDFGVDACGGAEGWYIDEVEIYSCTPSPPGLTVVKQVVNDDGGTATVDDFSIEVLTQDALVFDGGSRVNDTTTYTAAQLTDLTADVPYSLVEADVAGYAEGNWSCIPDVGGGAFDSGSVMLPPGEAVTCTIVNNDQAPSLTIVKQVVNDDFGSATVDDFNISSSAGALVFDGGSTVGDTTTYTTAPLTGLTVGVPYDLAEADVVGYTEGNWSCTPNAGGGAFDSGEVTLSFGENATCTISNDDNPLANLSITKTDRSTTAAPGGTTTYSIVVRTSGPSSVSDALVTDNFPAGLNCSYTSVAAGGASGNTAAGVGNIADTLALPANSTVTYTASCNIDIDATGTLTNSATVSSAIADPVPGNESATDTTDLVPSADLSIFKTDGLTSASPGGNTTYAIVVNNLGPSDVGQAQVVDSFPTELNCNYTSVAGGGASGNTADGAGDIADTLALPAGSSVTYTAACYISPEASGTLTNTASVSSAVDDPTPGNNSAEDITNLTASADLSISKTDGLAQAVPGESTTYTIVVSNAGPSAVSDAQLFDSFPADLSCSYTSVAAGGASGNTVSGNNNLADTLVLPPGSSVTYTVPCDIDADATGNLANTASVSSATADPNPGNNSATDVTSLTAAADLSITKSDGQQTATPGESTTYIIVVSNAGPSAVTDALVTDVFPAALTCNYTSVATGGATGNTAGSSSIFDTLTLPVGGLVTYTATCNIDIDAAGTLINTASVSSAITDPAPGDENATDTSELITADLSITKTDGSATAEPGGTTTYTIVVGNAGPFAVTDASVTDTFPAELTCNYTSVANGGAIGNTASGSGNLADTLELPVGGSVTYTVPCDIDLEATGTLSNTASVSSATADPMPGNDNATDFSNLTASADLSISKTDGLSSANPGGSATYTIVVSNAGPSAVSDALVTDAFPDDLSCSYTSLAAGGASGNTASGSGDLADTLVLPMGSSVTYTVPCDIDPEATGTLSNTASVDTVVPDPSPGDETATDTTDLTASADLGISKTDGRSSANPGGSTTYTIVVSNAGPSAVSDALVTDTFPDDLSCSYTSLSAGGASGNSASGNGNLADTLALPPGGSVTYTVPCDIDLEATGTFSNTASVSSATADPNPGNNSATDSNTLVASADLSISKSDGQNSATPGDSTTYTIVVGNAGPSAVSDAQLTDSFPADLSCTYTSVAAGGASGNTVSGSNNLADTLVLPPGSSVTYTVPCDIDADATGNLANTASVSSAAGDPNPGNNSATDNNTLVASADLSISKSDGQNSATPGDSTTYTIVVGNAGPSAVSDAQLTDSFPADLSCTYTSVAAGGASGNTVSGSNNLADTLVLPPGGSVTYTVPCDIDLEATGTLSNTASVSSSTSDPTPGNENATDTTNLTASADLSISKTDGQETATPGDSNAYTIVVSNAGPSTVNDANVTDTFAADLDCIYTSVAAGGASGNTASGSGNIADTLVLPPGSSVTYTAPCEIDPEATGTLSNTASVSSAAEDPNPGDESATDSSGLTASADLSLTMTDGQTSAAPGGNTTYTIVVNNAGPSTVDDANVTDTFATDLDCSYTSVTAGGASGNTASGSGDIDDTLVLPPGSSVTYTVPCALDAEATGSLSNTASVSSSTEDPAPGNESATDTNTLVASADLTITKTDNRVSVTPGSSTTYIIVVSNAGPSPVNDANVTDNFAAELDCSYTSVTAGGASGNTASGSGNIADTLVLPAGSSVTYTVPCTVDPETGNLSNSASVSSEVSDPNPGDESATDETSIVSELIFRDGFEP